MEEAGRSARLRAGAPDSGALQATGCSPLLPRTRAAPGRARQALCMVLSGRRRKLEAESSRAQFGLCGNLNATRASRCERALAEWAKAEFPSSMCCVLRRVDWLLCPLRGPPLTDHCLVRSATQSPRLGAWSSVSFREGTTFAPLCFSRPPERPDFDPCVLRADSSLAQSLQCGVAGFVARRLPAHCLSWAQWTRY